MSLQLEDLEKHFPAGARVPSLLVSFLHFQNDQESAHSYLGDSLNFSLYDCGNALQHWFNPEEYHEELVSLFVIFGHTKDGSMIGYWLYEGHTPDTAPIVILDSESLEYSGIVANSLKDFLALVALGGEEWRDIESDDWQLELTDALAEYRQWLEAEAGFSMPGNWEEIIDRIPEDIPMLDEWLQQWVKPQNRRN